jgi:hypothetical protein
MHHIDPAFLCLCQMGYMLGLEAVAQALGVQGKMEGMRGDLEPLLWGGAAGLPGGLDGVATDEDHERMADAAVMAAKMGVGNMGSQEARRLCLRYVAQDARATLDVYDGLSRVGREGLRWTTKKGTRSTKAWDPARVGGALLTVADARMLTEPDTSWMTEPRTRESCIGWAQVKGGR